MNANLSDEELIQDYLNGNDASFEILVKRYLRRVYAFTRQYTGDANNAADITQETFLKVWRNARKFDVSKNFSAWILTIAKNTALDWLRKKKEIVFSVLENRGEENYLETIVDPLPLPQAVAEYNAAREKVGSAIAALPTKYSSVVHLREKEDLTFKEIAARLNKPLNTVKSHYRRAVGLIRKNLK